MRVIFLAHTPASSSNFRVGSHFLARELKSLGHDVVHIPPVRSRWRRPRYATRAGINTALGIYEIEIRSVLPYGEMLRLCRSGSFLDRTISRRLFREMSRHVPWKMLDVVVVDKISASTIAEEFGSRSVVYRPTDLFVYNTFDPLFDRQQRLVERSEAVIATSSHILRYLESCFGRVANAHVLRNGADIRRLSAQRRSSVERQCVYVGAIDDRFDVQAVINASRQLPHWRFDLHGPVSVKVPSGLHNVTFHGPLHPDRLGLVLSGATVGLLPFRHDHDRNRGRAPMKYYEYLALGLPIVGPRLPELVDRADGMYFVYDDDLEVGDAIEMAASSPVTVEPASLMQYDWASITRDFAKLLGSIGG